MKQQVGSYEVLRVLARGGMAVVYLARQPALDRDVALKRLQLEVGDPTLAQRFVREARLAAGLDHPNVVTLFDFFEDGGVAYIAMEYVRGGTLRPLVGRLELPQVFGVLEGILAGLAHAEERGIAHRDLKPENVLLTRGGAVKIADFGIARAYNALTPSLTGTDAAIGTPSYMAPEQVLDEPLGPYTDIYAVGVIAYELLAGRPPFEPDSSPLAVLYCHVHKPPPPLTELAPDTPKPVCEWVEWLLAKAPSDRPASAAVAWQALEEIAVSELGPYWRRAAAITPDTATAKTLLAEDDRPVTPTTRETRRWLQRARLVAAAIAAAGAAAVAGYVLLDSSPEPRRGVRGANAATAPKPETVTPYDFDGDGRAELVLGLPASGRNAAGLVLVRGNERSRIITPKFAGVPAPYGDDDDFGRSVASGDFNGDGHADLAASAPGRDLVAVIRGTRQGLRPGRRQLIRAAGIRFDPGEGRYGARLLATDVDRNGFDDLVVGAPDADAGPEGSTGIVQIVFGGEKGLGDVRRQVVRRDESHTDFGTALRAGDVNGDRHIDLVEGAPDVPAENVAGHANFCRGTRRGPTRCTPLAGPTSSGTSALALADVDNDGFDDIIQGDSVVETPGTGALGGEVRVWRGGRRGPSATPMIINQTTEAVPGVDTTGDEFGFSVGAADLDDDGFADLVIGVPGKSSRAGRVTIVRGGESGHALALHTAFSRANGLPGEPVAGEALGYAIGVMDVSGSRRTDVILTARGAARPEDAVLVIEGGRGAFAPGETEVRRPLRRVDIPRPEIGQFRIARGPGA